ncbi:A-kinase anchor protein 7-like isoform X3 [Hippoglossus hippoglossus]|uniref:A-kinase anchor protein 7-like isoform X3 n=1 Tax=Hippoglossus hippoglossus TaxID=8267 RepID=UPI00148BC304|nr:A-kinase anchor protein 7-like isoform X3 [Hippoglossus hippoglossus]
MLLGRVPLSLRWTCSQSVDLLRVFVNEESARRLHRVYSAHCQRVGVFRSSAPRLGSAEAPLPHTCLCPLTVCDMQPVVSVSCGKEAPAIGSKGGGDDEGGDEGVVGQQSGRGDEGSIKVLMTAGLQEKAGTPHTGASTVSVPNPESTKNKRKRGDIGGRVDSEEDGDKKKKKKENQRPNFFVSIPITNTQISSAVTEVQEAVLQQEPLLARAMIPVPTLHITLLVTHLANQEQIDLATTVLAQVKPSLAELLCGRDLVLPFSGIGHFRKEVVFVDLAPGQHRHTLDSLAGLLRRRFEEQGLLQGDSRGFEPHLTIMKLSRASKLRAQGIKRVDPALYSNYNNKFFGDQTVERVDLCSMLKKKQQDGYYHTETSLQLDLVQSPLHAKRSSGRRRSEPDEAELLRVSRKLVEDAVNRALQQYKQETLQNGGGPNATATQVPGNTEEAATKTDTTSNSTADNRK